MARKKIHFEEENENWLITYADTITNLLAFFVLIVSVSTIDQTAWSEVNNSVKAKLNQKEVKSSLTQIKETLDSVLAQEKADSLVDIKLDADGIKMNVLSKGMFNSGEAELLDDGKSVVDRVVSAITSSDIKNFKIDVEGHTDDVPISNDFYKSNWELSTSRASQTIQYLIDRGVEPARLKASGYGDTKPIKPNKDAIGKPIDKNRAFNRRVVLRIYY